MAIARGVERLERVEVVVLTEFLVCGSTLGTVIGLTRRASEMKGRSDVQWGTKRWSIAAS